MSIFGRIKQMLFPTKILKDIPTSIVDRTDAIDEWFQVYKMKADWLDYTYRTVDGRTRKRRRLTMNAAKIVCRELTSLIFAEEPTFITSDKVMAVLEENNFLKNLQNLVEYTFALGGGAMKLRYNGNIIIDFVQAQNFVPLTWDNTRVTEASFISHIVDGTKKYTLVETHKIGGVGYVITNEMYDDVTQRKVPLPEGTEESTYIGSTIPMFTYIKPAIANNFNPESPLGVSLFANSIDTIKALDVTFDSLNSEMVLGRKRIIVPIDCIRSVVNPENGKMVKYFDPSDEVYCALDVDEDAAMKIQDNSVELRISEIKEAIQTLLDILAMQCGYSAGYLAFDKSGIKTATEVISDNSKTFKTKQSNENLFSGGIIDVMNAIRELQRLSGEAVDNDEYSVVFSDSVIEDRNSKGLYWSNLYAQGLVPLPLALQKIHGIPEDEAVKMAEEIESKTQVVSPFPAGV